MKIDILIIVVVGVLIFLIIKGSEIQRSITEAKEVVEGTRELVIVSAPVVKVLTPLINYIKNILDKISGPAPTGPWGT